MKLLNVLVFSLILVTFTILLIYSSINEEKRAVILDYLSKVSVHIQNIDLAKDEYRHIKSVFIESGNGDGVLEKLIERPIIIFKNEKFIMGTEKDKVLSKLAGFRGSVDAEIVLFGKSVDAWCKSVKDDTIISFSDTVPGNAKFLALKKIESRIEGLRQAYSFGQSGLIDYLMFGIPLLGSLVGLFGQAFSYFSLKQASE